MRLRTMRSLGIHNLALLILLPIVPSALGLASDDFDLFSRDLDEAEPLLCGVQCHCMVGKEDHIICNQTTAQVHKLTAQVYDTLPEADRPSRRTYVRVQDANQVVVTENFLLKWESYKSSALDLWDIEDLIFEPRTSIKRRKTKLDFGGVGIINSTVCQLPEGLISNKYAASLLMYNTTVDRIPSHTLMGVKKLRYLVMDESRIGLLRGSVASNPISLSRRAGSLRDVLIRNSTFGIIEADAIQIYGQPSYRGPEHFIMSNVSIGFMEKDSIKLTGQLAIEVTDTWISNMEAESLKINTSGSVYIVNNTFVGRPGLMVDLPCDDSIDVHGNLVIPVEVPYLMPTNMDAGSSMDSNASTEQPEGEDETTDSSEVLDPPESSSTTTKISTESSSATTKIPKPSTLLQRPIATSPPPPTGVRMDHFFHPLCWNNVAVSRDSIIKKKDVVDKNISPLDSKVLVFFLLACCILLLILLLCMVICNRFNKKKNKVNVAEKSIYDDPVFHWNARPHPFFMNPDSAAVSCASRNPPVVVTTDEPDQMNDGYINNCEPAPTSCCSATLDRPQACRTQPAQKVPRENEYCTMRSPDTRIQRVYTVGQSSYS